MPGLLVGVDMFVGDAEDIEVDVEVGLGKGEVVCVPSSPRLCTSRSTA